MLFMVMLIDNIFGAIQRYQTGRSTVRTLTVVAIPGWYDAITGETGITLDLTMMFRHFQ